MSNTMVGTIVPFALTYCAHGWAPPLLCKLIWTWLKRQREEGCWVSWKRWVGREGQAHPPHDPLQMPHLLRASLAKEIFPFH
jgi:hypothetical protein